jgi:hypothetical protein
MHLNYAAKAAGNDDSLAKNGSKTSSVFEGLFHQTGEPLYPRSTVLV